MENINKLVKSLLILVIIFASIGWILSYQDSLESSTETKMEKESQEILTFIGTKSIPKNNVLVTDRYVNKLDKDAQIITIGSDGAMYNVQNGVVLADNMVIKQDSESASVLRINQLRNSAVQHSFN